MCVSHIIAHMRTGAQSGERRRRELVRLLKAGEEIANAELAERLGVSVMTIRRDLDALADDGVVLRTHGGALAAQRITFEFAFDERRRRNLPQKRRIGAAAADRVGKGQALFVDTGTTTLEVARALAGSDLACTVVTSSLVIASTLWAHETVELVLLGGRVRRGSPDLVGPGTELMLEKLTADVAFLGSDGIDPERGSFAADMDAARVAERMARNARRAVVLADSSKLGLAGGALYADIAEIDELITDRRAEPVAVRALRRKGITVTLV